MSARVSELPDPTSSLPDLKNLTRPESRAALVALGEQAYRGDQVFRWVHARGVDEIAGMTDLARALRERLTSSVAIGKLDVDVVQVSRDGTRKLRIRTVDGKLIESVLIPDGDAGAPDPDDDDLDGVAGDKGADASNGGLSDEQIAAAEARAYPDANAGGRRKPTAPPPAGAVPFFPRRPKLTQCISSQVGCALDCSFCATAALGFGRNLRAGEIVDQVYRARAMLAELGPGDATMRAGADHVTNLVYMGMGEPLHNFVEVERSIEILTDEAGMNFSPRRITVSTAGLVPAIEKLGRAERRPNLAISLNATTDAVRDVLMPINKKWNIASLIGAVRDFPLERRRRVTFEYVLLGGVNDTLDDARRLPALLDGIPTKVNLIPWNPHPHAPYLRPSEQAVAAFHAELRRQGLAVYVRRSRGLDIDAACGQLAAKGERKADGEGGDSLVQLRR